MTEQKQFRAIRGTRDILPPDSSLWNWFERTARDVFESFHFREIRTPVLEQTDLFARAVGADTDIVQKEMFAFEDHEHQYLDRQRAALINQRREPIDDPGYEPYRQHVTNFVDAMSTGMTRGVIPKTPNNLRAIADIPVFLGTIENSRIEVLNTGSVEASERFGLYVQHIRECLKYIQLGDYVVLRPEATASVVRAYIEHGMQALPGNQKLYYVGPMFRRERPQKGRYRQFYQIGRGGARSL